MFDTLKGKFYGNSKWSIRILLILTGVDFSIHLADLLDKTEYLPYFAIFKWIFNQGWGSYHVFWSIYWGIGFFLCLYLWKYLCPFLEAAEKIT